MSRRATVVLALVTAFVQTSFAEDLAFSLEGRAGVPDAGTPPKDNSNSTSKDTNKGPSVGVLAAAGATAGFVGILVLCGIAGGIYYYLHRRNRGYKSIDLEAEGPHRITRSATPTPLTSHTRNTSLVSLSALSPMPSLLMPPRHSTDALTPIPLGPPTSLDSADSEWADRERDRILRPFVLPSSSFLPPQPPKVHPFAVTPPQPLSRSSSPRPDLHVHTSFTTHSQPTVPKVRAGDDVKRPLLL